VPGLASAGVASDARVSGGWRLAAALQGGVLVGVTPQAARPKVSRLVTGASEAPTPISAVPRGRWLVNDL
jgi:hypothetical protein